MLEPNIEYVSYINVDLINTYNVIKSDVESLITALQDFKNEPDFFMRLGIGIETKKNIHPYQIFRKAADQGNADAEFSLGDAYYNGQGVSRRTA